MQSDQHLNYRSGDLSVCPELGTVSNSRGDSVRLGPVNMRVLALLIGSPQTLISRNHIFEQIWKNQVVSDDALTRCISDIRSQLKALCPDQDFIETLPRRGYRWLRPVDIDNASDQPKPVTRENIANGQATDRSQTLNSWLGRGLVYLLVLVGLATAGVWLLNRFSQPDAPIVAVLPAQAETSTTTAATEIEEAIKEKILSLRQLQLLSNTAIASRPSNPFPYLYFEFGVQWVVETEVRTIDNNNVVTLTLVDARTGIIVFQNRDSVNDNIEDWQNNPMVMEFVDYLQSASGN